MKKRGSIAISIIIILSSLIMMGIALSSAVMSTAIKTQRAYRNIAAINLAEAGINKALWELNQGTSYAGEMDNTTLSNGSFDIVVSPVGGSTYTITATGYVPNKSNYQTKKTVRVKLVDRESSSKAAFFYGVQVGDLGVRLENNAYILGNVYSGGQVTGANNAYIRGSCMVYNSSGNEGIIDNVNIFDPTNLNPPYLYNAWASKIFNSDIYGDAKYSCNNTSCFSGNLVKGTSYPNTAPPDPIVADDWTIQDDDIQGWKDEVASYQTVYTSFSGSYIETAKVNGDMNVNGITTVNGLVHVTGNLNINLNSTLKLDSSYGPNSGLIIVDGRIIVGNNAIITGSGDPKSFIMLLSTKADDSLTTATPAITASNNSTGVVYYAKDGVLKINNNGSAKSFAGKGLFLSQNSFFKFDQGIRNPNFVSGPGGIWAVSDWQILY